MAFGFAGRITDDDEVVWKTEGLTDALAILSLDLPEKHTACTNGCGATERPKANNEWFWKKFAGKEVFVVHDCDEPGQQGAIGTAKKPGWAPAIAKYAKIVRNVVLPYEIQKSSGRDVRDWIDDQRKAGKPTAEIYSALIEYGRQSPEIASDVNLTADTSEDEQDAESEPGKLEEHPDDPHRLARINLEMYEDEYGGALRYWRQQWWKYKDGRYRSISPDDLAAKVTIAIKREFDALWQEENERYENWLASDAYDEKTDKGPPKVRPVREALCRNVVAAMKSLCILPDSLPMPCWIPDRKTPNFVALENGILSLDELFRPAADRDSGKIVLPHSKDWFSSVCLPYSFDKDADCPTWQNFLSDVFADDSESIEALQRWFGYQLLPDTSLHKMLFVIGRPRSGKGTIMRTMIAMLGRSTVAAPTLNDLAGPFALQTLIDKTVAVIADVRLSRRADEVAITERLLSITGEDPQDVHRKHLEALQAVRLPIRFTLFSNQIPRLSDSSAALMTRCIFLRMPNSYVGREDRTLGNRINEELPGILNWAIAGRYRLEQEGEIRQPNSGADVREQMERTIAPVSFFLSAACVQEGEIAIRELFDVWCEWSRENDFDNRMNIQTFSKKIHDVLPNVSVKQANEQGHRVRKFCGISIKKNFETETF